MSAAPTIAFACADDQLLTLVVSMGQRMCPVPYRVGASAAFEPDADTAFVLAEVGLLPAGEVMLAPDRLVEVKAGQDDTGSSDPDVLWVQTGRQRVSAPDARAQRRVLREAARRALSRFFARMDQADDPRRP